MPLTLDCNATHEILAQHNLDEDWITYHPDNWETHDAGEESTLEIAISCERYLA